MKKLTITTLALVALLASCGGSASQKSASDTAAADSVATETEYLSSDYQTFELQGHVKSIVTYDQDVPEIPTDSMTFDRQGRLTSYKITVFDGPDLVRYVYPNDQSLRGKVVKDKDLFIDCDMVRDAKGRLTKIAQNEFEYDKQGRVKRHVIDGWESTSEETTKERDAQGRALTIYFSGSGEGTEWTGREVRNYEQNDSHGNWTVMDATYIFDSMEGEGGETSDAIYVRTIEYWE